MTNKIDKNNAGTILNSFVKAIKKSYLYSDDILINATNFDNFQNLSCTTSITGNYSEVIEKIGKSTEKKDLVFGIFPIGMKPVEYKISGDGKTELLSQDHIFILKSLPLISESGIGLFLVTPNILYSNLGKKFIGALDRLGMSINAVFGFPSNLFYPQTAIKPVIILISKNRNKDIFVAEVDQSSEIDNIVDSLKNNVGSANLNEGLFINRNNFTSFENFKTTSEIDKLKTQYKEYKSWNLSEVSLSIGSTRENFVNKNNSIYIPKLGPSPVISNLNRATLKHQNYYQIVLNKDIVEAEYLRIFFKSKMGRLLLSSLLVSSYIPHINKSDLENIQLPVPDKETQNLLIDTDLKLNNLEKVLDEFKEELSLNPNGAKNIQGLISSVLNDLGKLNKADQILSLIRKGESKTLEFKQTFSTDIKTNKKEQFIVNSSLKNIVAFLNSDGGTLLVGVEDSGIIKGIERDCFTSDDKYLLNFKNNIKEKIGEKYYQFIDWEIADVYGKKVLIVTCKASEDPCYLNGKEFYVRTNPSVDQLEGPELVSYIKKHFD
jgi:hypothetical protein